MHTQAPSPPSFGASTERTSDPSGLVVVHGNRAERLLEQEIRQVVLGRPVHFATDEAGDRLAEARLLHAAFRARVARHSW